MSGKIISSEVRQSLLVRHKTERDKRIADRIKVVVHRDDDWGLEAIAEALLISHEAVRQHLLDYDESGKLLPENGGSSSFLDAVQTADLVAHLDKNLYVKASEIAAFVRQKYGVNYSVSGMNDWLNRNDFSFHQPCGLPAKADAAEQEIFVQHYEKLKENLGDDDQLLFMDGVHPSHCVRFVRGWIRRGERKEIPTNGSQKRLNILGVLNLEKMTLQAKEYATLNAEAVIQFLVFLLGSMPKGILHIVLDRGRYQNCTAVWEFAKENPRLRLHYLPPYSPNINAIEPAWKIMHEHTTNNIYHPTFKAFTEKIREFFEVIFPKNALAWTDRLTDNFRIMGTNKLA